MYVLDDFMKWPMIIVWFCFVSIFFVADFLQYTEACWTCISYFVIFTCLFISYGLL